ncbi:hypothetical protein CI238_09077 [Colletotrichum incanum]|uniref:Uncharacterized protein n=1 Tax=Colletotrichum incanum TaxID=1573173 RepID=A0A166RH35_COLIC|nr:hypothetical protein CI238_09077 [Colletotrichum incanum]OHW96325.1 hypothetical protein CSPAE12_04981 [Colletotrichum incanum]
MPDNDSSDNFFVRFKQKVDDHVASAFQRVLGIPTAVSRLNSSWPEPPRPSQVDEHDRRMITTSENGGGGANAVQPRGPSAQYPHLTVFDLFSSMSPMQALFETDKLTESLYQVMWISFLIDSPYSPLRLHDLPQPTPKDLPEGADPTLFGFEDAFEDLLMVSSGQGLPDINERVRFRKECRESFPRGLPPILWLHQLTRQGLWDGWDTRPEVLDGAVSERWRRWLQEQDDPFHEGRSLPAPNQSSPKEVEKTPAVENAAREARARPEQDHHGETEEDSYFSVMGKARLDTSRETSTSTSKAPKSHSITRDLSPQGLPAGWRVVEKVQEREDAKGNVHVTKTVTTFNDRGEEVGRQTERRSEYAWSASFSTGSNKHKDQQQQDGDGGDNDKSSWFWK